MVPVNPFQLEGCEDAFQCAGEWVKLKIAHFHLCYSCLFFRVAYRNAPLEMRREALIQPSSCSMGWARTGWTTIPKRSSGSACQARVGPSTAASWNGRVTTLWPPLPTHSLPLIREGRLKVRSGQPALTFFPTASVGPSVLSTCISKPGPSGRPIRKKSPVDSLIDPLLTLTSC